MLSYYFLNKSKHLAKCKILYWLKCEDIFLVRSKIEDLYTAAACRRPLALLLFVEPALEMKDLCRYHTFQRSCTDIIQLIKFNKAIGPLQIFFRCITFYRYLVHRIPFMNRLQMKYLSQASCECNTSYRFSTHISPFTRSFADLLQMYRVR